MSALGPNLTEPPLEERRCDPRRTQGRRRLFCRWPGGELTLETRDALGRRAGPTRFNTTSRDPMLGSLTRCRVPASFTAFVLGEHLGERINQVFARAGQIGVAAPAVDLAAPMASAK